MAKNKRVLLIIPAYNEEGNILQTVGSVRNFQPKGEYDLDYLVINDGSTDRTEKLCRENDIPHISLVQNLGIGGAVQCGYQYAVLHDYDIAVQFDGDGQHDIQYLDVLLAPILSDHADFTIGSRFLDETSTFRSTLVRRIGIRFLTGILRLFSGVKITDPTSGFRAAAKPVISFLAKNYPMDYPEPESIMWLVKNQYRLKEVPVNMFERQAGVSSINVKRSFYYMFKVSIAIFCCSLQRKRN